MESPPFQPLAPNLASIHAYPYPFIHIHTLPTAVSGACKNPVPHSLVVLGPSPRLRQNGNGTTWVSKIGYAGGALPPTKALTTIAEKHNLILSPKGDTFHQLCLQKVRRFFTPPHLHLGRRRRRITVFLNRFTVFLTGSPSSSELLTGSPSSYARLDH